MARMVVIYRTPKNVEAFDRHYFEIHVPLAKKIPGLRKYEVSDGNIATPVGTSDVHRIGTLYFDDLAAIEKAFASAEGQAAGADRRLFAPDDSGVQMFLFDNRAVCTHPLCSSRRARGKMTAKGPGPPSPSPKYS